jgi:hypothetical protein
MEMTLRQSFYRATSPKHANFFNKVIEWQGYKIAMVAWQYGREWKVVDTLDFDTVKQYAYKPLAEFHTQDELWRYIKANA